jgi:hypothetical protein
VSETAISPAEDALRHVELLKGSRSARIRVRLVGDDESQDLRAYEVEGPLADLHASLLECSALGYGVFIIVNATALLAQRGVVEAPEHCRDCNVTEIASLFVDGDNEPLPERWHLEPHFILTRPNGRWHAYWLVAECPVAEFRPAQTRLALRYGSDRSVCNPSRIMRLAGYPNMKDPAHPEVYSLRELHQRPPYSLFEVEAGLPDLPPPPKPSRLTGEPVLPVTLCKWLSWIDPTFKDQQNDWYGLARAIVEASLCDARGEPLGDRDDLSFRFEILDTWCSGELWRMRTGEEFYVSTYRGSSELADRVLGRNAGV